MSQKASGVQTAVTEAEQTLEVLKQGDATKQAEYAGLKKESIKVKKQLAEGEAKIEVCVMWNKLTKRQ